MSSEINWTRVAQTIVFRRLRGTEQTGHKKRWPVLLLMLAIASCSPKSDHTPLARGVEFFWNQQAKDGGWPSHTYGLLRSGQSLTPFVLEALLQVPDRQPTEKIDRAIEFIRRNTNSEGALGMMDPTLPDYPNY